MLLRNVPLLGRATSSALPPARLYSRARGLFQNKLLQRMEVADFIAECRAHRSAMGAATLGFVPTMGALHEGHISLIRAARSENDKVAVSIFVNPMQFSASQDLETYPRTLEADLVGFNAALRVAEIPSN